MQRLPAVLGSQGARERQGERRGPATGERRLVAGTAAIITARRRRRRRTEVEKDGEGRKERRGEMFWKRKNDDQERERESGEGKGPRKILERVRDRRKGMIEGGKGGFGNVAK